MKSKTLIVNYAGLSVGGIENYLSKLINYSLENGHRVLWLTTPMHVSNGFYRETIENDKLEKIYVGHGRSAFKKVKIHFDINEDVVMISCEPLYFISAEEIRRTAKTNSFFHFLLLPHFTGNVYYIERFFNHRLTRRIVYKYMKQLIDKWVKECCVIAFSKKHLDCLEENYKCHINMKEKKILKGIDKVKEPEISILREKARKRSKEVDIISVARFDFPHKGYLLGLINNYAKLKEKFPMLHLTVVGDGDGRDTIENLIKNFSDDIQSSIVLTGMLNFDDLCKKINSATVNVGLAGGATIGARYAVPTIIVRHYSYECEAYGFYEDVKEKLSSSKEGLDIKSYIEQIITMTDDEYIKRSLDAYHSVASKYVYEPDYLFRIQNRTNNPTTSVIEYTVGKIINFICWFKMRFMNVQGYNEQ